jgi:hypothetical protein
MLSGIEAAGMPSAAAYASRFQGLRRAYELIGYTPARDYSYLAVNHALRILHGTHVTQITNELTGAGASVRRNPRSERRASSLASIVIVDLTSPRTRSCRAIRLLVPT